MNLNFIFDFAKFEGWSWVKRSPWTAIGYIATPLALLVLIYILSSGKLIEFAVAGGMIALIATSAIMSMGSIALFKIQLRLQDLLIATKIDKADYMFGFSMSSLMFCVPGMIVYVILGLYFGLFTPLSVIVTLVVLSMLTVAIISIAFFMGSLLRNINGTYTVAGIMGVILTMLPPTYYPYTYLPKALLYLFMLSPVTPAAVLLQGYYGLEPINNYMFIVLAADTVIYFFISRKFTKWRDN